MADDTPAKAAKGGLDFLKQKAGPLPIGVWLIAGVGIWWYLQRQQSSSSSSASSGTQTDPAGNTGTIDPATGYVYGSPEDLAALSSGDSGGTAGQSSTTGGQSYADNNAWGIAAVNYLAGLGIDAATANQAVQLYLSSQPLTTAQQGDINLAIAALGPPPSLPGPVASSPSPVTTPPGSGGGSSGGGSSPKVPVPTGTQPAPTTGTPVTKTAKKVTASVPTGLVISAKHSTSLQAKWNRSSNATGYHVLCTDMATKKVTNQFDVPASQTTANCGGLTPGHSYVVDVWAEPEAGATGSGPHAETSVTLPKTG